MAALEKNLDKVTENSIPTSSSEVNDFTAHGATKDQAFDFLAAHQATDDEIAAVDLRALRRRIDWHILPVLFCCFALQFLDKVLLNYAAVMGINQALKLRGNDFSNVNTFTFVAILVAEFPNGFILNKLPAGKWLGFNVVAWGISTACVAAAQDYRGLLAARIFLGIFEASIGPCLMIICSQWYTKKEQPTRFACWFCGLGAGQIIGGLTSFGFQHVQNPSFAGWRIMFVLLGLITVVVGFATYFAIPDSPMKSKWMSSVEKAALLQHVSVNKTGVMNTEFKTSQLLEIATDPQVYLHSLMLMLISTTAGVTTTYSATLLRNIGYTPKQAAVLNAPSGVISIFSTLVAGFGMRYGKYRWIWVIICTSPSIIGGAMMCFVQNKGGVLSGVWLVNFTTATMPIIYHWVAANTAGHTKRPIVMAIMAASFGVGNIIGPQTFQARDAPQYIPAKITVLATLSAGASVAFFLMLWYKFANSRRDAKFGLPEEATDDEKWSNLTDKQNKSFRYVL